MYFEAARSMLPISWSRLENANDANANLLLLFFVLTMPGVFAAQAEHPAAPGLAGRVNSEIEGPMAGVLVRAKGTGSSVSITVVTNHNGEYSFPATRLTPRPYTLDIERLATILPIPSLSR